MAARPIRARRGTVVDVTSEPDAPHPLQPFRDALAADVARSFGVPARWIASWPVLEVRDGAVVWEGTVQVFALDGHAKAHRAFAWWEYEGGPCRLPGGPSRTVQERVIVLGLPGVTPVGAVRTFLRLRSRTDGDDDGWSVVHAS